MSYYYVYILQSIKSPRKYYIGYISNLSSRMASHNQKRSTYTKDYAPWKLNTSLAFENKLLAVRFEKYLKTGSGKAFMNKRLVNR